VRVAEERRFDGSERDVGVHRLEIDGEGVPLLGGMQLRDHAWLLYVRAAGRALCNLIMSTASDKDKRSLDRHRACCVMLTDMQFELRRLGHTTCYCMHALAPAARRRHDGDAMPI
jgi:hypothetical protein